HGTANTPDKDPEKGLSEEGKAEAKKIADFLKKSNIEVPQIIHSDKKRAKETAEIIGEVLGVDMVTQKTGLAPNDEINLMESEIRHREENLMIVGHLPFLDRLTSSLLTGDQDLEVIELPAAGVIFLENIEGKWELRWLLGPDQVG
ncbi:MAG: phosphohistidine phosphatase SixA, partial [bacterium]|nr:phosphohistidine phosphatase SixA [bacterium]